MNKLSPTSGLLFVLVLAALLQTNCTVKYVAAFDEGIRDNIFELAERIDKFWGQLLEIPEGERVYNLFKSEYFEIESELRVLVMKNEARPGNEESANQSRILLELWIEDKEIHREQNGIDDFIAQRHRRQFTEVFTAMAKAEEAKRMDDL